MVLIPHHDPDVVVVAEIWVLDQGRRRRALFLCGLFHYFAEGVIRMVNLEVCFVDTAVVVNRIWKAVGTTKGVLDGAVAEAERSFQTILGAAERCRGRVYGRRIQGAVDRRGRVVLVAARAGAVD